MPSHGDTFSDIHSRGQYWIIRNIDKWKAASIQDLKKHFNDPLINLRKAKDKKLYQSPYGEGYASDHFKDQGNAIYDKLIGLTEQEQLQLIKTKGKNYD